MGAFKERALFEIKHSNMQLTLIFLFHFLAFFIMEFTNFSMEAFLFYLGSFFLFIFIKVVCEIFYKNHDVLLVNIMIFFMDISLIMLFRLEPDQAYRQLLWFLIGAFCLIPLPYCFTLFSKTFSRQKGLVKTVFLVAFFCLLLLPSFYGTKINGAYNWVTVFGFSFQPSEICKFLFVFYVALAFNKYRGFKTLLFPSIVGAISVLILISQNDLGGALIYFVTYMIMLYIGTSNEFLFISGLAFASFVAYLSYGLFPHVADRVSIWLNPWSDPSNTGYQILQSLFAIGTYGPFGSGLTMGMPNLIPVQTSDFIFAAICEEFGGLLGLALICLYLLMFTRTWVIGKRARKKYLAIVSIGFGALLTFQAFLIIGGNLNLIPLTGVTLPLISYGGTSALITIVMLGIVLKISSINMSIEEEEDFVISPRINKSFNRVLAIFMALYLFLGFSFSRYIFIDYHDFVSSPYNQRIYKTYGDVHRGKILDNTGEVLAYSDGDQRIYPFDNTFAHIVGFNDRGKSGIESRYNFYLERGDNFILQKLKSMFSDYEVIGNNVITTLDSELQQAIYEKMGNHKGSVVVMEVKTGKVLSLISKPDFNPNTINENWDTLSQDSENSPLLNRAFSGLYPPGSTFKIISAMDIIHNVPDYEDIEYNCTGSITINNETIRCNNGKAHGMVNLHDAFTYSCNTFFANAISHMDNSTLYDEAENAYFNRPLDLDFDYKRSIFDLTSKDSIEKTMQTAIGQGDTLITPIHLAMIGSSIANEGIMYRPMFVSEIQNYKGEIIKRFKPHMINTILDVETNDIIKDMMKSVVTDGTGKSLNTKVPVAGKTGSAQVEGEEAHGLFVGFAPADDPVIAFSVVLENTGGSKATLPIVETIVNTYFE